VLARVRGGHADSAEALGADACGGSRIGGVLAARSSVLAAAGRARRLPSRAACLSEPGSWLFQQVAAYAAAVNGRCDEALARLERATALAPAQQGTRELLARLASGARCGLERS